MDWLSWIPGYSLIAGLSSNIVIIALAVGAIYFAPPLKRLVDPVITKIGEYLPGVTDYLAEGTKGLKALAVPSIVVLGLIGGAMYYSGKATCDCKKQVEANMTDLRTKYKFVPK